MSDEDLRRGDKTLSQTLKAQLALRELVLSGALAPGERVSELQMVDRLGVSRTPLRTALVRLEEEGLLEAIPSGGFAVRAFTEREVYEAIEIRGTLEGLAARLAAERGVSRSGLERAAHCLDAIDKVLDGDSEAFDLSAYVTLNALFHEILVDIAGNEALARQIARSNALPFASPSAFLEAQGRSRESRNILVVAQDQHRCVLAAIERREGARAEAIMREHARLAHRNLERALANPGVMNLVPGSSLIRRRFGTG